MYKPRLEVDKNLVDLFIKDMVDAAEHIADTSGGLPPQQELKVIHPRLSKAISKYPGKFSHILRRPITIGPANDMDLTRAVRVASLIVRTKTGKLTQNWLTNHGYKSVAMWLEVAPEMFAHLKK
jgi:hypothetical protein